MPCAATDTPAARRLQARARPRGDRRDHRRRAAGSPTSTTSSARSPATRARSCSARTTASSTPAITRRSSSATCGGRSPTAASGTARSATAPRTGTSTGSTRPSCRSSTTRGKPYQYIAIRADITARKAAEERLAQQAALARVGQMAAVVAHEVRNPLAGIKGAMQVLMSRRPAGDAELPVMRDIVARIDALERADQRPDGVRAPAAAAARRTSSCSRS